MGAMSPETKLQCLGGWGFLLLACGLFIFLPSAIAMAVYAPLPDWSGDKIAALSFLIIGLVMLAVCVPLIAYWCRASRQQPAAGGGEDANTNANNNTSLQSC